MFVAAMLITVALLWGEAEYGKTVCRAVMPGFDTDCNGTTAGSIFGMMHGAKAVPEKWTAPIRDPLHTGLAGMHTVRISESVSHPFLRNRTGVQRIRFPDWRGKGGTRIACYGYGLHGVRGFLERERTKQLMERPIEYGGSKDQIIDERSEADMGQEAMRKVEALVLEARNLPEGVSLPIASGE